MFKHPFKVKTNINVRNSDRKKLLASIGENSSEIFGKSQFSLANITISNGSSINIYICEKQPIFFELQKGELYPTVYLTWKCIQSYPTLFIPKPVLEYLLNGADLMLPGVILNLKVPKFKFEKGAIICVSVYSEKEDLVQGPIAIGKALMSSEEMINTGMKGKGVNILHVIQDELWNFGTKELAPIYKLSVLTSEKCSKENDINQEEIDDNVDQLAGEIENIAVNNEEKDSSETQNIENADLESTETTEEFLRKLFLYALRYKLPQDQKYPLDVGQFYATVILKALPEGKKVEMKKTKYKKFSTFLHEINKTAGDDNWFVKIISKKGVDSITDFNLSHHDVVNAEKIEENPDKIIQPNKAKIKVAECYTLTENSLSLIKLMNPSTKLKKSDIIHPNEINDLVKEYTNAKKLLKPGNKAELDDTLQTIMKKFVTEVVPINEIVQQLSSKMTKAYLITTSDNSKILRKTKVPEVVLKVEKRAGNKSVTLVNNLSPFGIDVKEFSQKIQHGLSTGATIQAEAQCCSGPQVLVLGNQVNYIVALLTGDYGLQKKYIIGADLGVKMKKNKK